MNKYFSITQKINKLELIATDLVFSVRLQLPSLLILGLSSDHLAKLSVVQSVISVGVKFTESYFDLEE